MQQKFSKDTGSRISDKNKLLKGHALRIEGR